MSLPARYLLDTNVVSETRKVRADVRVMAFLEGVDAGSLFISVLTIGELRKGVEVKGLSDRDAARRIGLWIDGLETTFADRILDVDTRVARRWRELSADRSRPVIDTLIGATALVHGLIVVTRNVGDLRGIALTIVDPWQAGSGKASPA